MAKKSYKLPFNHVISINSCNPINKEQLNRVCSEKQLNEGVSLIIKPKIADDLTGGYLFNIKYENQKFHFHSISGKKIFELDILDSVLDYINHSSGRLFNSEYLTINEEINFLLFNEYLEQ